VDALDADRQLNMARQKFNIRATGSEPQKPNPEGSSRANQGCRQPPGHRTQAQAASAELNRPTRQIKTRSAQDVLLEAGAAPEVGKEQGSSVQSFESYIAENKDELMLLQFFYSQPHSTGFATRTSAPCRCYR